MNLPGLSALDFKALWTGFFAQSFGFWCISFYLFIEYVRPQQIYTSLAVIPWGKIALGSAFVMTIIEGRFSMRERFLWSMLGLFTFVIFMSSITAYLPAVSYKNWQLWGIWLLAMVVVAGGARTRSELVLSVVLWCLWNFKMSQSAFRSWLADGFRFRDWGASGAPGWFQNSGEFGIEMCVFFPIIAYLLVGLWPGLSRTRRIILAVIALSAVVGAIASSSRGAILGLAAVGLWILLRSKKRLQAGATVLALCAMVWIVLPSESKDRWSNAGTDKTSTLRIQYWKDGLKIAAAHPAFGIGYKNWMPYYTQHYNPEGQLPHNIFIECVAELGYSGLLIFLLLIFGTFKENARTRKLTSTNSRSPDRLAFALANGFDCALVGLLASGFFITVLFYPYFWINLGFTMALSRYVASRAVGQPKRRVSLDIGSATRPHSYGVQQTGVRGTFGKTSVTARES